MACRQALLALPREAIYANIRKNPIKRTALSIIRLADRLLRCFFVFLGDGKGTTDFSVTFFKDNVFLPHIV